MKQLRLLAVAALAALGTQAHALDVATMNAAGTLKVYFAGASATKGSIGGLFTQNCQAGTRNDYTLASDTAFGTIYTCTLNATNDFGLGAINVMFQKRDAGGSGYGVYPVANNAAIAFIDPTTCSAGGTCSAQFNRVPDGGTSDVEPKMFEASLNTPAGFSGAVNLANMTVDPYVSTVFGLAVSNALYTKLQADQVTAGRPSVPRGAVAAILRAGFPFDSQAWKQLLPNTTDGSELSQVTICRRVQGSGTQASANRFFLEYPFNSGATMAPAAAGDSTTASHGTAAGNLFVVEGSSTGNVTSCLTSANAAGGFAIGHVSYENAETANWKFVKIDGQDGGRDNAKAGKYSYFFESTCQYRNALTGNTLTFAKKLCEGSAAPANLASLSAANQNGVMTPPQNAACPGAGAPATTFCSSVTRNGNSAELPSFY
jgi:hypothetical protein